VGDEEARILVVQTRTVAARSCDYRRLVVFEARAAMSVLVVSEMLGVREGAWHERCRRKTPLVR